MGGPSPARIIAGPATPLDPGAGRFYAATAPRASKGPALPPYSKEGRVAIVGPPSGPPPATCSLTPPRPRIGAAPSPFAPITPPEARVARTVAALGAPRASLAPPLLAAPPFRAAPTLLAPSARVPLGVTGSAHRRTGVAITAPSARTTVGPSAPARIPASGTSPSGDGVPARGAVADRQRRAYPVRSGRAVVLATALAFATPTTRLRVSPSVQSKPSVEYTPSVETTPPVEASPPFLSPSRSP